MQRPNLKRRLQSVLRDYQLLANSDPLQLRTLIPPTEIWRLFVESDRQDENFNLWRYLKLDKLRHGLGKTALNASLARVSILSSITTSKWPNLIKRLNLTTSDTESIKLGDIIDYNKGWFLLELTEPGYIKGLYRAFQCIYEKQETLNLDYICKVHQVATDGVENTNHRLFDYYKCGGKIRTNPAILFGLNRNNASEQGIYEILHRWSSYTKFQMMEWAICQSTPAELRAGVTYEESDEVKIKFPEFYQQILSAKNDRALARALYHFASTEHKPLYYASCQTGDVRQKLQTDANAAIDAYNIAIATAQTPMSIISAIARVINLLEDIHMFDDANCRTLCMITLNNLLYNCGLPLTLINDANRFDAKSHIELVETIIEGMENTFRLIKTGKLHGVLTSDLIALAGKPNTIGATQKYFEEAVAIEQRARRRLRVAVYSGMKRKHEEDDEPDRKCARYI